MKRRYLIWAVVIVLAALIAIPYAHLCKQLAVDYWLGTPGSSRNLIMALALTLPTSLVLFIPMYLYAAMAYGGGNDIAVAHAMGTWFTVQAVVNVVVVVGICALTDHLVRAAKKESAPLSIADPQYAWQPPAGS